MTFDGLTVVTVLYRSAGMLAETLPTWVRSAGDLPIRFVFADNWPSDGCAEVIAGNLPADRYAYLPDSTNPGFAAGCNRGGDGRHEPPAAAEPGRVAAGRRAGPDLRRRRRRPGRPARCRPRQHGGEYVGIDLNPVSLFIDRRSTASRAPLGLAGGAAVFPAALYRRFGGFDEHLFAWGEDADLAFRLYAARAAHARAGRGAAARGRAQRTATAGCRGSGRSCWPATGCWSRPARSPGRCCSWRCRCWRSRTSRWPPGGSGRACCARSCAASDAGWPKGRRPAAAGPGGGSGSCRCSAT
ncbi:hypothetical protein V2I01_21360 [Micromonospora sp. BRA006-A]|nr:hypothetical protein [Micromonospora sp. BRA006-A]